MSVVLLKIPELCEALKVTDKITSTHRGHGHCVAKGADNVALRIREVAEENGVPVMENPPLAQALYAGVEIGEDIPPEHFKAVAESTDIFAPMSQFGWSMACSGVTSAISFNENSRNGPPDAVKIIRCTLSALSKSKT